MRWDDNLTLEGDDPDLHLWGQYQLAMYAVHLSWGNSTYSKTIKAATIEQYLLAASSFLALFLGHDLLKDNPQDRTLGHLLTPILRDIKKYESVAN